jgi:hypothetical protein
MIKVKIKKLPTARTGYQVQGALVNDVPAMGGRDYNAYIGAPKLKESKYITAVPREEANLEAEGGETVYGDINGDGFPEHKIIKGPRHHAGGVPLNLPDDTFIFSDTRGMRIKDPEILEMFGKAGTSKAYTPAELAKQYDIQKYRKILEDPNSDKLDRTTAELMIKKFVVKLGCLALAQEAKKGFPQGIPAVARPCMQAKGITDEQVLPKQEIKQLTEQLESKYAQQKSSEETMQSEDQIAAAEQMNQGQPVAQPEEQQMQQPSPEEMMMYGGGMRRLRRAEEGMEQQMMEQPQEEGGDDMMQIVQEVSAALEQGVDPQEIVASLLENQLPPEAIVEVFMQLGASQEEAVGLIQQTIQELEGGQEEPQMSEEDMMMQQQMQQQAPMAMYGMSMGGYDMPFYDEPDYDEEDIPEAEYGMAMGSGMSQNYQGRPKPIPGSGPMFPLPKANNGIIIKRSDYASDADYERAVYTAYRNKQINKTTDPITVIDASGQSRTLKGFDPVAPSDTGGMDLNDWGGSNSDDAKFAAAQYYLLEQNLKDEKVADAIYNKTIEALKDTRSYVNKHGVQGSTWEERGYALPDKATVLKQFLQHEERNLKIQGRGINPELFSDGGREFRSWSGVKAALDKGIVIKNPGTGQPIKTEADFLAAKRYLAKTYGGVDDAKDPKLSVTQLSAGIGEPLENDASTRALQQATFHGYARTIEDYDKLDPDTQYALRNLYGNLQRGVDDESSMSAIYTSNKGIRISPVDDFGDLTRPSHGNSTIGHVPGVGIRTMTFDDPKTICQCTDPKGPNYGAADPQGKCDPALCPKPEEDPCPCFDTQGNKIPLTPDANGNCPPCETEVDVDVPGPPAEWWLQDTIKTTGAFGDLMGIKKYMPWAPGVELQQPRPTFLDPTRELAANAEQANIQTQGMAQFAGPQALSARSSSVQGQAAKNAADILSKYNNANVNIANQFELKGTDIANQESMLKQASAQKLYDQNTIANQQFDNSKLAMRNNLRNYYTNAITNRWQTDALNQMYPNYAVSPGVGGRMFYQPGNRKFTGQGSGGTGFDWQKAKNECTQANPNADSAIIKSCIEAKKAAAAGSTASTGANANIGMGMYGSQTRTKKKGGNVNPSGYIYINPFIL